MFGPATIFGFIIATLWGTAFHLLVGGDIRRLALFLLAGWVGFSLGHLFGVFLGINLFTVGTLRIVSASLGAIIALVSAYFLTSNRNRRRSIR